jgi:hypothetical protein
MNKTLVMQGPALHGVVPESATRSGLSFTEALLPLLVGGLSYLCARSTHTQMFQWFEALGVLDVVLSLRSFFGSAVQFIPASLLLSLPAALWSYSVVAWMGWVWRGRTGAERGVWVGVAACLGPTSEIMQASGLISGTFDPIDLLLYSIANLLALLRIRPGGHDAS